MFLYNVATSGGGVLVRTDGIAVFRDCYFEGNDVTGYTSSCGGAIYASNGIVETVCCVFQENEALTGGGICLRSSKAFVNECDFRRNEAGAGAAIAAGGGSTLNLRNSALEYNDATGSGGGLHCHLCGEIDLSHCDFMWNTSDDGGAGIHLLGAQAEIRNCSFTHGHSELGSGGCFIDQGAAYLENCALTRNESYQGGGIHVADGALIVVGASLFENSARVGGAIFAMRSDPEITDCTMAGNDAFAGGAALRLWDARAKVRWTLIAFNTGGEAIQSSGSALPRFQHCDLFGNEGGDWIGGIANQLGAFGNISADPLFCDLAAGDLTLHRDSPCVRAGDMLHGTIGAHEIGCGSERMAAAVGIEESGVDALSLSPNPFGGTTRLAFTIPPSMAPATLTIHDPSGRLVREWQIAEAGAQVREWDGTNQAGMPVGGGVYFCRLKTSREEQARPVIFLR